MNGNSNTQQRAFVRLVVSEDALTFEGQPTSWDSLGPLLAKVPNRSNTVLELAVTSDQITVARQNEWVQKATALARQHGFEYASFIGVHPLGSKGSSAPPTGARSAATGQTHIGSNGTHEKPATEKAMNELSQLRLRHAEEAAATAEAQFKIGRIPQWKLQVAKDEVAILRAEIAGDAVGVAQVRLAAAERFLLIAKSRFDTGQIPGSEYQAAKNDVELRKAELKALTAKEAKPSPVPVMPVER